MDPAKGFGRSRGRARGRIAIPAPPEQQLAASSGESSVAGEESSTEQTKPDSPRNGGPSESSAVRGRGGYRYGAGILTTKPQSVTSTVGERGREITLICNYFKLKHPTDVIVHQYHVEFEPNVELQRMRRQLIMQTKDLFGCRFIFDGMSDLKTFRQLSDDELEFIARKPTSGEEVKIIFKYTNEVPWGAFEMLRMYNTQMRRNLQHLGYVLMGRYYYDKKTEVKINAYGGIGVWRGALTAIAQHDGGVLMACDTIYKFVRMETVRDVLQRKYQQGGAFKDNARRELAGCIVMTQYNNRTYRIDDIAFGENPRTKTFEFRGHTINLVQYYKEQYELEIRDVNQPLIECLPTVRDRRSGRNEKVYLVPEFCAMTGLTDEMRADFDLCKKIDTISKLNPQRRVENLNCFMRDLVGNVAVRQDMSSLNLGFETKLVEIRGRQLDPEKIFLKDDTLASGMSYDQDRGDFTKEVRGKQLLQAAPIDKWIVLISEKDKALVDDFVTNVSRVCGPMGIILGRPKIQVLDSERTSAFLNALKGMHPKAELVVCVVPNNNKERYDSIKKFCCCDRAIASQVVLSKTLSKKQQLMSVCTKISIQMTCKMGGEAWALHIPPKSMMVVGYDTYHDGALRGKSAGGFVASMNQTLTKWFSKVAYHTNREEMSSNFALNFKEALKRYYSENGKTPDRVVVYRDGVGDGMIPHVYEYEMKQIKQAIRETSPVKLVFIIVTKRINSRFLKKCEDRPMENPPPGTIVDTVVTRPERYEFYLISQSVRQGTVTPTLYNIIEDESSWKPQMHQALAYKLTHLYYNWTGTIRVPAPCQYAHKLAYLTGTSLHRVPDVGLGNTLFYL